MGAIYIPNPNTVATFLLTSGTECVNSDCFEDLDDQGKVLIGSVTHQYNMGGLPGGVAGQAIYLFDSDLSELDDISFNFRDALAGGSLSAGLNIGSSDDSWIVGGSFWQYISLKDDAATGPVNLINREADLRGYGIFGRLAFADEDTNPWNTTVALGVGGRGVFDSRPDDMFGVGYYYNDLSENLFSDKVDDGQGTEAFYNFAITPAVHFTTSSRASPTCALIRLKPLSRAAQASVGRNGNSVADTCWCLHRVSLANSWDRSRISHHAANQPASALAML